MSDACLCPSCERVADAGDLEDCIVCGKTVCPACDRGTKGGDPLCGGCEETLAESAAVKPPAIFTKGLHTRKATA